MNDKFHFKFKHIFCLICLSDSIWNNNNNLFTFQGLMENLRKKQAQLQKLPVVCETRATIAARDNLEAQIADINSHLHLLDHYQLAVKNIG